MNDYVEYYEEGTNKLVARVQSSVVPDIGRKISVRGETWNVQNITFAIDYADKPISERIMRTNIDLVRV